MLGNFGAFSFLRSWKLTRFLTTCLSATSFKIWTFSAFLYISEMTGTKFVKSLHIIFIMYIKMSETFIKIDSLQHLEISRQIYPTNRSKICVTTFTVLTLCKFFQINADNTCIYPWLGHFSVSIVNVLHSKDAINSIMVAILDFTKN